MRTKWIWRYDPGFRALRIVRVMWFKDGGGFRRKLSLALRPVIAHFAKDVDGWSVTTIGVRLHYQRSYGGLFV